MIKCPFCDKPLLTELSEGWLCACGEFIPYGFEVDTEESCENCPVMNCPNRK